MKKIIGWIRFFLILWVLMWCADMVLQRQMLNENLIRLHVVANSDSEEDQAIKLQVRDAVMESLRSAMADIDNVTEAKAYVRDHLPEIQRIANEVLIRAGQAGSAVVTLAREQFDTRTYETFRLPAGVYESLRIVIGTGEGHNWWCVVFPSLCIPATSSGFADIAVGAGFDSSLTAALEGQAGYEIRFYLLDQLGRLENIFFQE